MPVPQPGQDDFKHVSDQDRNVTGLAHLEMSHWDFGRRSRFAEVGGANRSEPERDRLPKFALGGVTVRDAMDGWRRACMEA